MEKITFYMNVDGILYVADERHVQLFDFLNKLGVRETPYKSMTVLTTTHMGPGTYTVSMNVNGQPKQSTFTVASPVPVPKFEVKIPKVEKYRKGPDREQRKQWRTDSKKLSRNTGRRTGGR